MYIIHFVNKNALKKQISKEMRQKIFLSTHCIRFPFAFPPKEHTESKESGHWLRQSRGVYVISGTSTR